MMNLVTSTKALCVFAAVAKKILQIRGGEKWNRKRRK